MGRKLAAIAVAVLLALVLADIFGFIKVPVLHRVIAPPF